MKQSFYIAMIATLLMNTAAIAQTATTPPAKALPEPANKFTKDSDTTGARLWNLQDADILGVINEISLETGKNFIVDPRVSGKISLVSSKPIKPNEVYDVFLSILELLGYSALPSGNVVKIIPNTESGEHATRVATRLRPGKGSEVVVRVIPLENVAANQLIPIIRPMLPQWSNIAAYTPGNVLILLGRAANLDRIVTVIHNIDTTSSNDVDIIPLHQASAAQMANVLANLQSASRASGDTPQVSIAADERSNSILLSGNKYARLRMKFLVQKLDTPTIGSQDNTQVIYLRYLKAKDIAPILGKIVEHMLGKESGKGGSSTVSTAVTQSTYSSSTSEGKTQKSTPANETNIQAEPSTNALIITAPPAIMRSLNVIIAKLDMRPAQVLIEAIIVEINQDDLKNLGIQWGSRSNGVTTDSSGNPVSPDGFPPLGINTFGIMPSTQIKAVLSALQNIRGVNILSTPSLVVLDNHKGTLKVGKDIATQTGSYTTPGSNSAVQPFNTVERKPVVLELDVTPQINLGRAVRLNINLKNDSLQNPDDKSLNPVINTSNIKNSVIINSKDILVIGGLISSNLTDDVDKIPILGDVPMIGPLFQHKIRKLEKKNLIVFIKPVILHNAEDAMNITNTKYNMIRQAQIDWPLQLDPGAQKRQNVLPLWRNDVALPEPFSTK